MHRDIKPENILIGIDGKFEFDKFDDVVETDGFSLILWIIFSFLELLTGHIKMVDFGTAKDMIQTDLNGPEFVGTAEYMSPLAVNSKPCGYEADLWAMGILLHQMLLGYTAFAAASPYLTFLRIKKAMLKVLFCVLLWYDYYDRALIMIEVLLLCVLFFSNDCSCLR